MGDSHQSERERLLTLLHRHGILYASDTQPVLSRDGTRAQWMLDSLCVTLGSEGIDLAARCLLRLLARFDGRQIATYGTTAIPLVAACVLQSHGRYQGLLVRKERKAHGSRKLIEGIVDPDEPVIIVDDSVSSGMTMEAATARLEEAGLRVEGGICLVRFGWYGGFALMQERGYQMEAVFDIYDDFIYRMEGEADPLPNPSKVVPAWQLDDERRLPEGLHPSHAARAMIEARLREQPLPAPPERFDTDYDAGGGVWISLRSKRDVYHRWARNGLWNFPEEEHGPLGLDLARAAVRTAADLPAGEEGLRALGDSAIAVTFFPAMEACTVGELDNDRYGIVVRSRERLGKMGGALPRMPGIRTGWEQFEHARRKNAGLVSFEPFELLRHEVVKAVEPGEAWQPTGVPRGHCDDVVPPEIGARVANRARALALDALGLPSPPTESLAPDVLAPYGIDSIYVTVYLAGRLRGCMGSRLTVLDDDLRNLAGRAFVDDRFDDGGEHDADAVAVTVSFLAQPLALGTFSPQEVMARIRLGEQALMVEQGSRVGLLLPFVAATHDLGPEAYALEVIDKAGITRPPYHWRRFACATWSADATARPRPVDGGLPRPAPPDPVPWNDAEHPDHAERRARLTGLLRGYLLRHQGEDGRFFFRYRPHQDVLYQGGDLPRIVHGLWVVRRAARLRDDPELLAASDRLLGFVSPFVEQDDTGEAPRAWLVRDHDATSIAEVSFLLLALSVDVAAGGVSEASEAGLAPRLAATLWGQIDRHGRIASHREAPENEELFQDYFPGQALLALARATACGVCEVDEPALARAFRVYRHRFRQRRRFGQVSWQMQAWAAWSALRPGDDAFAELVFEIGDWILTHQEAKSGGFLGDHQRDAPGYTTALYLEGVGAALGLARSRGDRDRVSRYRLACARGYAFLDRLIIQSPMASFLPNPEWAIGGVRTSLGSNEIRIDFVQHALSSLLEHHDVAAGSDSVAADSQRRAS